MKGVIGAGTVLLLVVLLTWLLLRGLETDEPAYVGALQALDDYASTEASLHRDVLRARAGLLRNYDPLVSEANQMDDEVARLRVHARQMGANPAAPDRLAATVADQQALAERFKSNNALLQNSLAYFDLLSTGQDASLQRLQPAVGALALAMQHLMFDTSPQAILVVQDRIDQLEAYTLDASGAVIMQALLAHARMLENMLPEVDQIIKALLAVPSAVHAEAIRAEVGARHADARLRERRYRLLLYGASLLLLWLLIYLGHQLRDKAVALQRRANFEHIIAESSTSLINCSRAEIGGRLLREIGELGRTMHAERAYVVLNERPARIHLWNANGAACPPGWPEGVLGFAEQFSAAQAGVVVVPDVRKLPANSCRQALRTAGVRRWACVPLFRAGNLQGVMGVDFFHPSRGRPCLASSLMRLASDAVFNAIERDVLEQDRDRLTTRLERARRMQAVGGLASGIAHNFNNILGAILGYVEMAGAHLAPGTKPAQHVDEIRNAAERGRDLVESILTFGRRRDARTRSVPMAALLEETAPMLGALLPPATDLAMQNAAAELAVLGEPVQLQQVLLNLCTNAAQAMDGAGRITVAVDLQQVDGPRVLSHGELMPGRYVRLVVSDTGRGFDEATARRIFEPFFTTRPAGTGLGLATVLEIVRDHDGALDVRSAPGQGSSFEVWLPEATEGASAPLLLGRGETVLIVESERLLGDEELLAALGYEPVGFSRASEALAACQATPERFDVLVVGGALPKAIRLQVAHALREAAPTPPLLLAIKSDVEFSTDALAEAGVTDVLHRPFTSTELAAVLARCLQQGMLGPG